MSYSIALPAYAELHCLSNFTFLRGASHADELVRRAQTLGYTALAITDECSLAGIVRAHVAAKEAGLQLIIGSEFRLEDGLRLVLLAPEREAYGDLCELITRGRRRAAKGSYQLYRGDVADFSTRLLALYLPAPAAENARAGEELGWLTTRFDCRLWLGVELLQAQDDVAELQRLQRLGKALNVPCVAMGDVHMHVRSRRLLQDTVTAIRHGQPVSQCGFVLHPNGERHLRSRLRLARLYPPALLHESVAIAARCQFSLDSLRYEYPEELVPAGLTPSMHLRELTLAGLQQRYPQGAPPNVQQQVDKELALIAELAYEPFFLTVHDIVSWAQRQNILCQGRGSAANSAVCFALGITAVDPANMDMLFERFLSRERNEPPDIDVDFEHQRREEVIQYIYRKYGRERTALAATVISYRSRSALRDVGRALGLDETSLERLSKTLAWWDKKADLPQRLQESGFDPDSRPARLLLYLVGRLSRFPRHLSQHVGGFIISSGPLMRLVPIENAAMDERTIIQWDKDDLEELGLLKVDVLALGMLTAIRRTLDMITLRRGRPFSFYDIPRDDPEVYAMISRADTVGVFQIESRAQMSMLPRLQPKNFYDLVIEVSLVRPGPIQGNMVHPYLRRRQGLEPVDYPSPEVQKVLQRTLGVPIFQEQVMELAVVAGGFTPGEADQLRRSMASWRKSGQLEQFKKKLMAGMLQRGYQEEFAQRIFSQIEGFSEYGFPESHAASFAHLVWVSAWLKHHEPEAFLCGLLNALPMGFYSASQLIQDAQRHAVEVRPVDVQTSYWPCTLESGPNGRPAVRLGFCLVKGLRQPAAEALSQKRPSRGYMDVQQLQERARPDKQTLSALAEAGALAALSGHRRQSWWQVSGLDTGVDLGAQAQGIDAMAELQAPTLGEDIVADYGSTGLSLRAHPLSLLRPRLAAERLLRSDQIRGLPHGCLARGVGIVVGRQRPGTRTGVVFVTLEDESGNTNVIVWSDLVEKQRRELLGARLLVVYGVVQREGEVVNLLAKRLVDRSDWLGQLTVRSRDFQ